MFYIKPFLKSFCKDLVNEKLGLLQNQYDNTPIEPTTVTLNTQAGDSGYNIDGVLVYLEGVGVVANVTDSGLNAGDGDDNANGAVENSFLGFDLSDIPVGSTINSATLRINQVYVNGTPYTDLGNMIVDQVNFGNSIDNDDWDADAITSNIGTISNSEETGWKELDVTSAVETDMSASRTRSQFRIRFNIDSDEDGTQDDVYIESGENSNETGSIPELVVEYQ